MTRTPAKPKEIRSFSSKAQLLGSGSSTSGGTKFKNFSTGNSKRTQQGRIPNEIPHFYLSIRQQKYYFLILPFLRFERWPNRFCIIILYCEIISLRREKKNRFFSWRTTRQEKTREKFGRKWSRAKRKQLRESKKKLTSEKEFGFLRFLLFRMADRPRCFDCWAHFPTVNRITMELTVLRHSDKIYYI